MEFYSDPIYFSLTPFTPLEQFYFAGLSTFLAFTAFNRQMADTRSAQPKLDPPYWKGNIMNIFEGTKQNITEALMHYVCMRMQFRAHLLTEPTEKPAQDKYPCSNKECSH